MSSLSIATDYVTSSEPAEPYLKKIAQAGFSHIHWCHDWNINKKYSDQEIKKIKRWFVVTNLKLQDIHAACTPDTSWASPVDSTRKQGLELIKNRMEMAAALGAEVVVLHAADPIKEIHFQSYRDSIDNSLADLGTVSKQLKVKLAMENLIGDDFLLLTHLFKTFGDDFIGLCYDSGHGNIGGKGLDFLEKQRNRLIAVHLHDNDGTGDQHRIPFHGTVDWERLTRIIAGSSYQKCLNLEVSMGNHSFPDEPAFLQEARAAGVRLNDMVEHYRLIQATPSRPA